ncbi:replicative DNA helicase loader DnaB [Seinonella peptonophila]|uniref:Replicative DNA helicase loader DnaB n=1 Tax=Seinonella peptonophila TaxID=112248 RepID=A0A1M4W306_9BACL|nr:DnaD domain protein [Seinonella peptonophila]SHE75577.1 replicative DNA helicase loader DnaB [Seinonella peptonophila]
MIWKDSGWRCRSVKPLGQLDLHGLTHLYQPLVGTSAISLYITLYNQLLLCCAHVSERYAHSYLMQLTALRYEELMEARYYLEAVGLLNTYEIKEQSQIYYDYEILAPLTAIKFFQSDVLSLALCHALGKERFTQLKQTLLPGKETVISASFEGEDVTKSFQEVFGSFSPIELAKVTEVDQEMSWMMKEENLPYLEGKEPKIEQEGDLSFIRQRLSGRISSDQWTPAVVEQLKEIQFLYRLDDWGLYKALQNPEVTRFGEIHFDRLQKYVRDEYQLRYGGSPVVRKHQQSLPSLSNSTELEKPRSLPSESTISEEERHFQQLAEMTPLELLSHYQEGSRIPDSDVSLVESLLRDYGLAPGVVNVLLEYVLLKYDYRLPKALVVKIAGHWKRLRIQTVAQALEQARKEDWEVKQKTKRAAPKGKKEKVPQALSYQVEQHTAATIQTDPTPDDDWMQINQQLALWEKQKQKRTGLR